MKQIRLAYSGSGSLAPIHGGATCCVLDRGVEIVEVAGTSGGSIAAALVACGFDSAQIKQICLESLPNGVDSFNFFSLFNQGWNSGDVLLEWLHQTLGEATFATAKIPVTIMATDIENRRSYKMSRDTTPSTKLYEACRASSSVPFVFEPYVVNGVKCCDGGMCCNLPLDQLILDSVQQVGIDVKSKGGRIDTSTYPAFAESCIQTMLQSNEDNLIAWGKMFDAKVIEVDASPYGFLDFALPESAKLDLFNRGYQNMSVIL